MLTHRLYQLRQLQPSVAQGLRVRSDQTAVAAIEIRQYLNIPPTAIANPTAVVIDVGRSVTADVQV